MKTLLVTVALFSAHALASSGGGAGGPGPTCSAATCSGCCTYYGCEVGGSELACGSNGSECVACGQGQLCQSGKCVTAPPQGCSSVPVGFAALAVLTLRRRFNPCR